MASRDHLVSEQRVDKNGVKRTYWVKPATTSGNKTSMPAPRTATTLPEVTNEDRREAIISSVRFYGKEANDPGSRVDGLLARTPPEQLHILDAAIAELTDEDTGAAAKRRKYVTSNIIRLCMDNTTKLAINDLLKYREAFNSYWCQNNHLRMNDVEKIMFGIRGYNLPFDEDAETPRIVACIRFAYEMQSRFPEEPYTPLEKNIFNVQGDGRSHWTNVYLYKEPNLANLIWKHYERVDEMIAFAVERKTSDVQRIEEMLDLAGSKAFSEGIL